ncbi:MAG: hypothetical protein JJU36_11065 [Phycisphaeraceae bacterium]|nr:hypothetical protein [Phycisphaeraceae bacterium]
MRTTIGFEINRPDPARPEPAESQTKRASFLLLLLPRTNTFRAGFFIACPLAAAND